MLNISVVAVAIFHLLIIGLEQGVFWTIHSNFSQLLSGLFILKSFRDWTSHECAI